MLVAEDERDVLGRMAWHLRNSSVFRYPLTAVCMFSDLAKVQTMNDPSRCSRDWHTPAETVVVCEILTAYTTYRLSIVQ